MKKERIPLWFDEDEILNVFNRPEIKKESDKIFKSMNYLIRVKIDSVLDDIYSNNGDFNTELSKEKIANTFKKFFYVSIFKKAIMYLLADAANSDDVILSLLTERTLTYAIYGEPMKDAFLKNIYSIHVGSGKESCLIGRVADTVKNAFNVNFSAVV